MRHPRLLIVGDSITLGAAEVRGNTVLSTVTTCYVDLLREALPELDIRTDADVHRTTGEALIKLPALLATYHPTMVLFLLGGNDADIDWRRFVLSDGAVIRPRTQLEKFEENLARLAETTNAARARPMMCDIPGSDLMVRGAYVSRQSNRDVLSMITRRGGQADSDAQLREYQQAAEGAARRAGADFIAYGQALAQQSKHLMLAADGTHPSSDAHRVIAETLVPAIQHAMQAKRTATPA
jgi:lysophospholipase L1-like esterase